MNFSIADNDKDLLLRIMKLGSQCAQRSTKGTTNTLTKDMHGEDIIKVIPDGALGTHRVITNGF